MNNMALNPRTCGLLRNPKPTPTDTNQDTGDTDGDFAKVMEAYRAGQKMRQGKPHVLSKDRRIKLGQTL